MYVKHPILCGMANWSLLLVAALLALPAPSGAAPPPEETAHSSPWFPETLNAGA